MIIKELDKDEYIELSHKFNLHPLQSYAWGELKRPDWTPLRLGVYNKEDIISILTILIKSMPFINSKFGYVPRGLALRNLGDLNIVLKEMINYIRSIKISFLLSDPDLSFCEWFANSENIIKKVVRSYIDAGFIKGGRQEQPIRSVILDLAKSEEEMLADMRSKNRQYIRKSIKNGVKIEVGEDKHIENFCEILEEIAKEKNYVMHEMKYYKNVWENFRKEDKTVMLIAKYKEKTVGAYMILFSKYCAYEMFGGCNKDGSNLLANYALKWESIKYAKNLGKKFYDQWGAELVHPGLVQFKEGFGGKVIEYPNQYVYIYNSVAYKVYKLLRKARNLKV